MFANFVISTRLLVILLVLTGIAACDSNLSVKGDYGYTRCLAAPVDDFQTTLGGLSIQGNARKLKINGLKNGSRIAFFSGPAPFRQSIRPALSRLAKEHVRLAVVLGNLGDRREEIKALVNELSDAKFPSLIMAGGRDEYNLLKKVFSELRNKSVLHVVNAYAYWMLSLDSESWVMVSGAAGGRYARKNRACAFEKHDLKEIGSLARSAVQTPTALLSWASARSESNTRGLFQREGGNAWLKEFADQLEIPLRISAWPTTHVGFPEKTSVSQLWVAPPIAGGTVMRVDSSSFPPSALVLDYQNKEMTRTLRYLSLP